MTEKKHRGLGQAVAVGVFLVSVWKFGWWGILLGIALVAIMGWIEEIGSRL